MKLTHSIPELVEAGPFSENTLMKHVKSGALPARKIGRRVFVMADDWRAFLESAPLARDCPEPYHPRRTSRGVIFRQISERGSPMVSGLLTTAEAARRIKRGVPTLNQYRGQGRGPVFVRVGGRVFYRPEDLDAWAAGVRGEPAKAEAAA